MPEKKRISSLRRLKIISGQIEGLMKLLEKEEDCEKIFPQIKAIKSAFGSFSGEVMKDFLEECLIDNPSPESTKKMIEKFSQL